MKPHRGVLILVFGILSLVVCPFFGIAAWVMANNDLQEMTMGRNGLDRTGYDEGRSYLRHGWNRTSRPSGAHNNRRSNWDGGIQRDRPLNHLSKELVHWRLRFLDERFGNAKSVIRISLTIRVEIQRLIRRHSGKRPPRLAVTG